MNWKIALAIMSAAIFMMGGSYTMVIPFLPLFIARDLGAAPEDVNLLTGIAFSISFLITFVAAPIWGRLADLYGRKPMFLRSCFTIMICYFLFFIARSPTELILARALQGFGAGMLPIALSITSAWAPKEKIGIAMGTLQGFHISGTVFGPLFGGLLADSFGIRSAFLIAGLILLFLGLLVSFTVKEPRRKKDEKSGEKGAYRSLLHDSVILTVLTVTSLAALAWLMQQPLMALFVNEISGTAEGGLARRDNLLRVRARRRHRRPDLGLVRTALRLLQDDGCLGDCRRGLLLGCRILIIIRRPDRGVLHLRLLLCRRDPVRQLHPYPCDKDGDKEQRVQPAVLRADARKRHRAGNRGNGRQCCRERVRSIHNGRPFPARTDDHPGVCRPSEGETNQPYQQVGALR